MGVLTDSAATQTPGTQFERWWNSPGTWVEPANRRRGGESGVQLLLPRDPSHLPLYCKRQIGHTYRSLLHPFGRPTILRELEAYRALARLGIKTPNLVYCAARHQHDQWQALLVTEALQGFVSLEHWYAQSTAPALKRQVLRQLASTLARLHLACWQHGCCYPKHIFVKLRPSECGEAQIEIALLDLEKSRRRWQVEQASRHDLGQLLRHRGSIPQADVRFVQQAHWQALRTGPGTLAP